MATITELADQLATSVPPDLAERHLTVVVDPGVHIRHRRHLAEVLKERHGIDVSYVLRTMPPAPFEQRLRHLLRAPSNMTPAQEQAYKDRVYGKDH